MKCQASKDLVTYVKNPAKPIKNASYVISATHGYTWFVVN